MTDHAPKPPPVATVADAYMRDARSALRVAASAQTVEAMKAHITAAVRLVNLATRGKPGNGGWPWGHEHD